MSDTPRTDKLEYEQECNFEVSWEDHSRQLERELNTAKAALSGRTVSCSNCNALAAENAEMREAIKEAHSSISMCVHFMLQLPSYDHLVGVECEAFDLSQKALTKLPGSALADLCASLSEQKDRYDGYKLQSERSGNIGWAARYGDIADAYEHCIDRIEALMSKPNDKLSHEEGEIKP